MHLHKIILLGDPNVGKTSLKYWCLAKEQATPHQSETRLGFDVTTSTHASCQLEIWDLKSHKYFYEVPDSLLNEFDWTVIVFDMGHRVTFENVNN